MASGLSVFPPHHLYAPANAMITAAQKAAQAMEM